MELSVCTSHQLPFKEMILNRRMGKGLLRNMSWVSLFLKGRSNSLSCVAALTEDWESLDNIWAINTGRERNYFHLDKSCYKIKQVYTDPEIWLRKKIWLSEIKCQSSLWTGMLEEGIWLLQDNIGLTYRRDRVNMGHSWVWKWWCNIWGFNCFSVIQNFSQKETWSHLFVTQDLAVESHAGSWLSSGARTDFLFFAWCCLFGVCLNFTLL